MKIISKIPITLFILALQILFIRIFYNLAFLKIEKIIFNLSRLEYYVHFLLF